MKYLRIAGMIVGALCVLMGVVWIFQGINVIPGSFMTGDIDWSYRGGVLAVVGLVVLFLSMPQAACKRFVSSAQGRDQAIDGSTARPAPSRGLGTEIVRGISAAYLKLGGWRMHGDWPALDKAVLVAAPHTSNWDGLNMLAAAGYYRVKLRWMGKASLTRGPFGWLIKALGCVPIDRSQSNDVVRVMADAFAASKRDAAGHSAGGDAQRCAGMEERLLSHRGGGGRADPADRAGLWDEAHPAWRRWFIRAATTRRTCRSSARTMRRRRGSGGRSSWLEVRSPCPASLPASRCGRLRAEGLSQRMRWMRGKRMARPERWRGERCRPSKATSRTRPWSLLAVTVRTGP